MAPKLSSTEDASSVLDLQKLLTALASAARAVQGLPSSKEDYDYECSFPEFGGKPLQSTRSVWLQLVKSILHQPGLIKDRINVGRERGNNDDDDDIDDDATIYDNMDDPLLWDECAEMCEALLEQITELDKADDEAESTPLSLTASRLENAGNTARSNATSQWNRMQNLLVTDLPKPQDVFAHLLPPVPENARTVPFIPAVHPEKPFGITPLPLKDPSSFRGSDDRGTPENLHHQDDIQNRLQLQPGHGLETRFGPLRSKVDLTVIPHDVIAPAEHCPHLYEDEIRSFQYTENQLLIDEGIDMKNPICVLPTLEYVWIDTVDGLEHFVEIINSENVSEIAVDLEAHSYRSFAGLVCLMQVTVRMGNKPLPGVDFTKQNQEQRYIYKNFLIDTLVIERRSINLLLAPIFANPTIVKVLHGADHDIPWLQRDFGIYVVNLFDTGRAARALTFQSASYAYLLKRYCSDAIVVDKTHQLADWRQRPLTPAMQQYAIQDTQYLLEIYDRLKIELFECGGLQMIKDVLDTSRNVCLVRYMPEPFKPSGYRTLIKTRKYNGRNRYAKQQHGNRNELNHQQEKVLRELWDWRDQMARRYDESTQYVCTNQTLLRLAMACPTTISQMQSLFHPIPTILLQHAQDIINLVKTAKTLVENEVEHGENEEDDEVEEELQMISNNVHDSEDDVIGDDDEDEEQIEDEDGMMSSRRRDASVSSTFFKPANISVDDDVRRRGMMSPVLGTEALYKHAGWMTSHERESESRKSGDIYFLEQQMKATSSDEGAVNDFNQNGTKPKRFLSVHSSNTNYKSQQNSPHSLAIGQRQRTTETGSDDHHGRARTLQGMASVRETSNDTTLRSEEMLKAEAVQKSSCIESSLKASIPIVMQLVSCTPANQGEGLVAVVDDDDGSEDGAIASKDALAERGDRDELGTETNFVIPRSIREIYQISNRNRRTKKAGSPTPDHQEVPMSETEREELVKAEALMKEEGLMDENGRSFLFDENEHKLGPGKRPRAKLGRESEESVIDVVVDTADRDEDLAFMKGIGWVQNDEDVDSVLNQRFTKGRTSEMNNEINTLTVSNEGDVNVTSKDVKGEPHHDVSISPMVKTPPIGLIQPHPSVASTSNNPFFSGAALVGGPLAQQGLSKREPRKGTRSETGNWRQSSGSSTGTGRQQERPEKRGDRTFSYRKK